MYMSVCVHVCACVGETRRNPPLLAYAKLHTHVHTHAHTYTYWRMQNCCTTSDRLKRFVFQRCRLLLVVNVPKKHTQCKYATLYGYETVAR